MTDEDFSAICQFIVRLGTGASLLGLHRKLINGLLYWDLGSPLMICKLFQNLDNAVDIDVRRERV